MIDEGYIKFNIKQINGPAPKHVDISKLNKVRSTLHEIGLIGIYPNGIGYGNVSIRLKENKFIITGSATGEDRNLSLDKYTLVDEFNLKANSVKSIGPIKASSESMTHGAIYEAEEKVNCVIHIHSRKIFDAMRKSSWIETPESAAFGTPDLAFAIADLVKERGKSSGVFVTAGHDEGIIAYGSTIEEARDLVFEIYTRFK